MNRYKIFLILLLFLFSMNTGFTQSARKAQRKTEKIERKRLEKEEDAKRMAAILAVVKDRSFVVEASTLRGKYSFQHQVSPSTNFIMIDGKNLILQTAGGFGPGYNGLGGVTINGRISDYEILNPEDNDNISLLIQFTSSWIGPSTLNLSISADGYASASVRDNWGGRVHFRGQIETLDESTVFEGTPLI